MVYLFCFIQLITITQRILPKNAMQVYRQSVICDTQQNVLPIVFWRVYLCPQAIQVMAIQRRSVASVVECRCLPPLTGIAGIAERKMGLLSQILPVGNCHFLRMQHGAEVNHKQHMVAVNQGNLDSLVNSVNLENQDRSGEYRREQPHPVVL